MKKKQVGFLKQLLESPSPTGFEEPVAQLVRDRLSGVADEIRTDTMGSVQAVLRGCGPKDDEAQYLDALDDRDDEGPSTPLSSLEEMTEPLQGNDEETLVEEDSFFEDGEEVVDEDDLEEQEEAEEPRESQPCRGAHPVLMLSTHMDEIGLMVTYISDDGFLSVAALGGVDAAILPGMRVDVHTASGPLRGVVGRKPIHLIESDDRKNVTPLDKLVVDVGMPAKDVLSKVEIGDPITFGVGFERFGKDMAVSRAFDDKCGVFISCRVMEKLAKAQEYRGTFVSAITVQEEIGTRGAMTSAHAVHPDVAIAFDVTHATDYPGIDKSKYGDIVCGGGPVIARGPNINPLIFDRLVAAAEAEGIPYQIEAEPSVTGTDARAIQVTRGGIATGLVSVPLRYMHTPTEVVCLSDIEATIRLLARFALDLEPDACFVPGIAPRIESPKRKRKKSGSQASKEVKELADDVARMQVAIDGLQRSGGFLGRPGLTRSQIFGPPQGPPQGHPGPLPVQPMMQQGAMAQPQGGPPAFAQGASQGIPTAFGGDPSASTAPSSAQFQGAPSQGISQGQQRGAQFGQAMAFAQAATSPVPAETMEQLDPSEAPFGRQHQKLQAEFAALDLEPGALQAQGPTGTSLPTPQMEAIPSEEPAPVASTMSSSQESPSDISGPDPEEEVSQEETSGEEVLEWLPNMNEIAHGAQSYMDTRPTGAFDPVAQERQGYRPTGVVPMQGPRAQMQTDAPAPSSVVRDEAYGRPLVIPESSFEPPEDEVEESREINQVPIVTVSTDVD